MTLVQVRAALRRTTERGQNVGTISARDASIDVPTTLARRPGEYARYIHTL